MVKSDMDWEKAARGLLKSLLAKHSVSYKELSKLLSERGTKKSPSALSTLIHRGQIQLSLFLEIMDILEVKEIHL